MKKLLLSAALLSAGVSASFAQTWNVGEEITDKVEWGNLSFTSNPMDFWKIEKSKGSTTETGGLFEVYDGADVDLYQYVKLPAGLYRVEAQAYYRFGNSWAEDPSKFGTSEWQDLAQMYVQNGTYNIDSEEFSAVRTFQAPVMPRLYEGQTSQLYVMPEGEATWDMSDGSYTVDGNSIWGPCSVPGSLIWFAEGHFMPAAKYNSVSFFVPQEGYVRVGISKKEAKEADSFMATNWKMYYEGEAGKAVELVALQEDIKTLYSKLEEMETANPGLIYSLISDARMDFDDEYGDALNMDVTKIDEEGENTLREALKEISDLNVKAEGLVKTKNELSNSITGIKALADHTNYTGKPAFLSAIEKALTYLDSDYVPGDDDDFSTLETVYNNLLEARTTYVKSQEAVDGAFDYTTLISYPWFCLPQYEPTWDAENNVWVPNEEALNETAEEKVNEDGTTTIVKWSEKDDVNGTINSIAKGVNVYGKEGDAGVWYQTGGGGSLEVYWNDKLTCIKKWSLVSENYHDVSQRLVNIPNGYYKLKALAQTWTNDWNNNCENHIFIKSNAMESHSPFLEPGGWWGNDVNQWKELETDMILVDDGEVIISSRDNGFAAFTGFRLYYYGETPNFDELLKPQITAVNEANSVENGIWQGDVAAVNEILAALPATIQSKEEFAAAAETLNSAKDYIAQAQAAINSFTNTIADFSINNIYTSGEESDIVGVAFASLLGVGENETDSYKEAQAGSDDYAMYAKYLEFVVNKAKKVDDANLKAVIASQYEVLTKEFANAAKLTEYYEALAAPYNAGVIASLGNATLDNPVDATSLIINSKFEEGNKGYTGDMTVYSDPETKATIIERYNTNSDINQTVSSLPAGTYEIRVQSFYRDGGDANAAYNNWNYGAGEEMEFWETKSAILYANDNESYIRSIGSEKIADQMTKYCTKMVEDDEFVGDVPTYHPEYTLQPEENPNGYPWDTKVEDVEDVFYYPNSVQGSVDVWMRHPEAYWNTVQVYLPEPGSITFGVKEGENIGGDWLVLNQFKLFYLGTQAPTAINSVANSSNSNGTKIYSVSGAQRASLQKGLNIVKKADGTVVKVLR